MPRPYPKLKEFPSANWKDEFALAAENGIYNIEWVFEANNYANNPIWITEGRNEIKKLTEKTGVAVLSLCADYFLVNPLHRDYDGSNSRIFMELIPKAADIGISLMLIPVLEEAQLASPDERERLIDSISSCIDLLKEHGVRIGIETELPATEYLDLIQAFDSELVGAYYDTGNSACRGYDIKSDLEILMPVLFGVHIKDRPRNGASVYISSGDTNFEEGIPFLEFQNYQGHLVFESFYEDDPIGTMRKNIEVINSFRAGDK